MRASIFVGWIGIRLQPILYLMLPAIAIGQYRINGIVENAKSEPVPFATVYLTGLDTSRILRLDVTDDSGRFSILAPDILRDVGKMFLHATYLRSESALVAVQPGLTAYELKIGDTGNVLSEITVESKVPVLQMKADRFIFTPEPAFVKGSSVFDVLKISPLINVDERTEAFTIINKQGTVVLINNRKTHMPREMVIALLRSTPAEQIKNIEIITNPGSEYEANTAGGIININLKKPADEGWSTFLSLSSQQSVYNTTVFNGTVNYHQGKLAVKVSPFINNSFNYNSTENWINPQALERQDIKTFYHRTYFVAGGGLGVDYDLGKTDLLSFNGFLSSVHGSSSRPGSTTYYLTSESAPDSVVSSPINGTDRHTYNFGNLYYEHNFGNKSNRQLTANVDYNLYSQNGEDDGSFTRIQPPGYNSDPFVYKNYLPQNTFNLSGRIDYGQPIAKTGRLNMGLQTSGTRIKEKLVYTDLDYTDNQFEVNEALSDDYKYSETYFAGYAGYNRSFGTRWNANAGLRIERTLYWTEDNNSHGPLDSNYTNLFPNFSISYNPGKKSNFSLAASKRIRRPTTDLLFPGRTYYNSTFFKENNPFLRPVLFYDVEALYSLANKYYFTVGYAYNQNQFGNFVLPVTEQGVPNLQSTYVNYGHSSMPYLNIFAQEKLLKNFWDLRFSATLNYSSFFIQPGEINAIRGDVHNWNYNFWMGNTFYLSTRRSWTAFVIMKYNSATSDIGSTTENALFSLDLGVRKSVNRFTFTLYAADLPNTYGTSRILYRPNTAYTFNKTVQNSFDRSISLTMNYFFGNNHLKTIKNKNSANEEIKKRINN